MLDLTPKQYEKHVIVLVVTASGWGGSKVYGSIYNTAIILQPIEIYWTCQV